MTIRLLLDEHYGVEIAQRLRAEDADLRAQPDVELFRRAARDGRRIVTENVKDFRPLLTSAHSTGDPLATLLLVSPRRFPRGSGDPTHAIVSALTAWLSQPTVQIT